MHKEILSTNQAQLLSLVAQFKKEFYLVGGTAVALHIGHRRSMDYDLFKFSSIRPKNIINKIVQNKFSYTVTRRVTEQLNVSINNVKFTFYQYPFEIKANETFDNIIKLPDLITLAAIKAYALGRRSKWKDYVDLYFIIKDHYTIKDISEKAIEIFKDLFSEKLFRAQLSYFDDIDYSEPIDCLVSSVPEEEIKKFLIDKAVELF
jgi:hypothetical protein